MNYKILKVISKLRYYCTAVRGYEKHVDILN